MNDPTLMKIINDLDDLFTNGEYLTSCECLPIEIDKLVEIEVQIVSIKNVISLLQIIIV